MGGANFAQVLAEAAPNKVSEKIKVQAEEISNVIGL